MIGRRSHDDAQSFDDALAGRTPRDEQVAELVRIAERLCEAAALEPSPAFRQSLRTRLMTEAPSVLVPMPSTPSTAPAAAGPGPVRRRVAGLTTAAIASAGVVGLVVSSASAVPGEMLYPVKRTVESAELALHRGDASRGSFQLDQASERLAEARTLSGAGESSTVIAETLDEFVASATGGSRRLFDDYASNGEKTSIRRVNEFAAASSADLAELSTRLPEGLGDSFAEAGAVVTALAGEAATLCTSCKPADVDALRSLSDVRPEPEAAAATTTTDDDTRSPAPAIAPTAAVKPSAIPTAPRPSATATERPPTAAPATPARPTTPLAPVTDPLLGGLLGDDDQDGLVPRLVDGLLGPRSTP